MGRRLLLTAGMVVLLAAALTPAQTVVSPRRVVFVADGAGDFQEFSKSLRTTVDSNRLPIEIVTFDWSHGYKRIVADQTDGEHARRQGYELARRVSALRQCEAGVCVSLAAHSAGALVSLAAA